MDQEIKQEKKKREYKKRDTNNNSNNINSNKKIIIDNEGNIIVRQKRKYTKRTIPNMNGGKQKTDNTKQQKEEKPVKKRGRKKNDATQNYKVTDVVDYMIRNFPDMEIEKIREKVIEGMTNMRDLGNGPCVFEKFVKDGIVYYNDTRGTVLNKDGQVVGYIVEKENGVKKMYLIKKREKKSYQEIISEIEKN